jgi:hypothetical protein
MLELLSTSPVIHPLSQGDDIYVTSAYGTLEVFTLLHSSHNALCQKAAVKTHPEDFNCSAVFLCEYEFGEDQKLSSV